MIRYNLMSLKIDVFYAVNSFIYTLRRLPIFRDLLTDDIYNNALLKKIIMILGFVLSSAKRILFRLLYFYVIYFISDLLCSKYLNLTFIHVYFIFYIIGLFINNKLLSASSKKYFSIILFSMDAKLYLKSNLIYDLISSILLNSLGFFVLSFFTSISFSTCLLLIVGSFLSRIVGEAFNIWFYIKNKYLFIDNNKLYFLVVCSLLLVCLLPYFGVFILDKLIFIFNCILFILAIVSIIYMNKVDDYKLIFKRINSSKAAMNKEEAKSYSRQAMVEVRDKDKVIDSKKIKGKKGYDLFNTIFFERHREILLRSAKKFAFVLIGIYTVIIFLILSKYLSKDAVSNFLLTKLSWFVLIMYFVNRGEIVTQAMFFNCDHAMLTYNFYRNPKVILGLFKKRLITVIKVNLIPTLVIAIGNMILLYLSSNDIYWLTYFSSFVFILLCSIFFSVHYLVIYYLLQPYNKDMQMKKASYSIVSLITYFVSYKLIDLVIDSLVFSILGIVFTISYIGIGLFLVYKFSYKTFKIN